MSHAGHGMSSRQMSFRPRLPRLDLRRRAPALALLSLYAYIGFHALSGSQGLSQWWAHEARSERLLKELAALQGYRASLQSQVDRLSAKTLDLDTLDIEARRALYVAKPGEITIWLDP